MKVKVSNFINFYVFCNLVSVAHISTSFKIEETKWQIIFSYHKFLANSRILLKKINIYLKLTLKFLYKRPIKVHLPFYVFLTSSILQETFFCRYVSNKINKCVFKCILNKKKLFLLNIIVRLDCFLKRKQQKTKKNCGNT